MLCRKELGNVARTSIFGISWFFPSTTVVTITRLPSLVDEKGRYHRLDSVVLSAKSLCGQRGRSSTRPTKVSRLHWVPCRGHGDRPRALISRLLRCSQSQSLAFSGVKGPVGPFHTLYLRAMMVTPHESSHQVTFPKLGALMESPVSLQAAHMEKYGGLESP